jgi:hypothetical protein
LAIDVSPVQAAAPSTSVTDGQLETFEERWGAWRAKGIARDRALRRKMAIAASIVIIVAVLVISVILAG